MAHRASAPGTTRITRAGGALRALVIANARFWPTIAPTVQQELGRWRKPADAIGEHALRSLAVEKLTQERFNAEVAATLATLAAPAQRRLAVRAIVALELLFDYLDGRSERSPEDPITEGERLFAPFIAAVEVRPEQPSTAPDGDADWFYRHALSECTAKNLNSLPAAQAVGQNARESATRCAQAQTRLHAVPTLGEHQLQQWASARARASGLGWREYVGGCASSVLAVHALIAAATRPTTTLNDAARIDATYLAIGGVITALDSLVDQRADTAHGEQGFIDLFDSRDEFAECLLALTREALARTREAPDADHHTMTLAGVVAYYTSHPGAADAHARPLAAEVRRELSPVIWPTLGVVRAWRSAKSARAFIAAGRHGPQGARERGVGD